METGTFTSRDTYAGRVRDIMSQNRYTYAENNPVTFADLSGHKKIGAMIGSAFSNVAGAVKNTNTGKNQRGGIGGIVGNAVQTAVDTVISTVSTVQNITRNTFNRAAGKHGAVVTSINGLGGITSFVESVAAQVEAARCQGHGYCNNAIREAIKRDNNPSILFRINSEIINNLHGEIVDTEYII